MNLVSIGAPLELEALSRPEVNEATSFPVFQSESPCCSRRCCFKGKSVRGYAIFAHDQGIVVQKGGKFLLNNAISVNEPPALEELKVTKNGTSEILGYTIPSRIVSAFAHPWGAIILEGQYNPQDGSNTLGFQISLLVLPR